MRIETKRSVQPVPSVSNDARPRNPATLWGNHALYASLAQNRIRSQCNAAGMVRGIGAPAGRIASSTPLGNTSCGSASMPTERTASLYPDNRAAVTGAVGEATTTPPGQHGSPCRPEDHAGGTPSWSSARGAVTHGDESSLRRWHRSRDQRAPPQAAGETGNGVQLGIRSNPEHGRRQHRRHQRAYRRVTAVAAIVPESGRLCSHSGVITK